MLEVVFYIWAVIVMGIMSIAFALVTIEQTDKLRMFFGSFLTIGAFFTLIYLLDNPPW